MKRQARSSSETKHGRTDGSDQYDSGSSRPSDAANLLEHPDQYFTPGTSTVNAAYQQVRAFTHARTPQFTETPQWNTNPTTYGPPEQFGEPRSFSYSAQPPFAMGTPQSYDSSTNTSGASSSFDTASQSTSETPGYSQPSQPEYGHGPQAFYLQNAQYDDSFHPSMRVSPPPQEVVPASYDSPPPGGCGFSTPDNTGQQTALPQATGHEHSSQPSTLPFLLPLKDETLQSPTGTYSSVLSDRSSLYYNPQMDTAPYFADSPPSTRYPEPPVEEPRQYHTVYDDRPPASDIGLPLQPLRETSFYPLRLKSPGPGSNVTYEKRRNETWNRFIDRVEEERKGKPKEGWDKRGRRIIYKLTYVKVTNAAKQGYDVAGFKNISFDAETRREHSRRNNRVSRK